MPRIVILDGLAKASMLESPDEAELEAAFKALS